MARAWPAVLLVLLVSCSASEGTHPAATSAAGTTAHTTTQPTATTTETGRPRSPRFDQALHDELLAMVERDRSGRNGGSDAEGDAARTARLAEILDEHGWPTYDLVGEDGEDAAWAIAQHSDQDPVFQRRALELLREAVAAGQGSPGNLAYLEGRVAVGAGEPQVYGTQVGCGPDGPVPATPIAEEAGVDDRRAAAGPAPLADYLEEMARICSSGN